MKIKFIDQEYQTEAVNSVADIFGGCERKESLFTIDLISGIQQYEGFTYTVGHANKCTISDAQIMENVRAVQERNGIKKSADLQDYNFTVEMETGTGKTYVYIETILELNKRYGFTKFIVVVPSIAIKEGVAKSFEITKEHFSLKYDNVAYDYFVYDSSRLSKIQNFAESSNIQIMIINIDAFRKSFDDTAKESKANVIHRASDKLSGNKPIDLIASTNPVVIIDEPQSVDNTKKAKEAIKSLHPLCKLRYSATHKEVYNLMYRLTPVDAYNKHLVKSIEVDSVVSDEQTAKPYVKLIDVTCDKGYKAKIEIFVRDKKDGSIKKKIVTAKIKSDLWDLSNEVDYYKSNGYIVDNMNAKKGEEDILFANGEYLKIGESSGVVDEDLIRRSQIRATISDHLEKELQYVGKGIKVLSLFFIDKVANYRLYEGGAKGKYAEWFEEEFTSLINGKYKKLKELYPDMCFDAESVHSGYFSKDGKNYKDTNGTTEKDDTTYSLIMKDKEKLLSLSEPTRFIFSHSALKEGWDNPNVFQICTLTETRGEDDKRQKVGRGLRIAVDQSGNRVQDYKYNVLTVVANESYKDFAENLQKGFTKDGYKFGVIEEVSFTGITVKTSETEEYDISQEQSEKLFKFLKENDYIGKNNKPTDKYYIDVKAHDFEVPPEFNAGKDSIIKKIDELAKTIEIKNKNEKIKISKNDKVIASDVFNAMWNKIKQKTIYSVRLPLDKMKAAAIENVANMPKIEPEKVRRERVKIKLDKSGVNYNSDTVKSGDLANISEYEQTFYPDFIRRLQDATGLLRSTVIEVVAKSGRLSDFYVNPEVFIKYASTAINKAKSENLLDGIRYRKLDDEYYSQEDIFDDSELYGYKNANVLDISNPDKTPFDHVLFDSAIESQFAKACDEDDSVVLYAKLPSKFVVDTPFGNYNPDWMVVIQEANEEHKLYFVAETKGTNDVDKLKFPEKEKVLCGKQHFEITDETLKYEVVDSLLALKQR